ncbi:aminoglycoside phosphotransferase family protein [Candidatus Poribacteria bacterium]|nr:aminoglycoside phosphotransferase family protein [Candidatus Poribacteria bacterium]
MGTGGGLGEVVLGKRIAEGRMAELFALDESRVVKLFRPDWGMDEAESEARRARLVWESGVPTPQPLGVVEACGRAGIVFERVHGREMAAAIRPWNVRRLARSFADLHVEMHSRSAPSLPDQRPLLERKIRHADALPDAWRDAALCSLAALPTGDVFCHGDFHPKNVMMTRSGATIIDCDCVTQGNGLADAARSILILELAARYRRPPVVASVVSRTIRRFIREYRSRYMETTGVGAQDVGAWRLVVAAGRLSERIEVERGILLGMVRKAVEASSVGVGDGSAAG